MRRVMTPLSSSSRRTPVTTCLELCRHASTPEGRGLEMRRKKAREIRWNYAFLRWSVELCRPILRYREKNEYCSTLQHTAAHCNILQDTATRCDALQHTATHCKTLQHTAAHCNTLQRTATHCNAMQHTAAQCNILQRTATHCSTM